MARTKYKEGRIKGKKWGGDDLFPTVKTVGYFLSPASQAWEEYQKLKKNRYEFGMVSKETAWANKLPILPAYLFMSYVV